MHVPPIAPKSLCVFGEAWPQPQGSASYRYNTWTIGACVFLRKEDARINRPPIISVACRACVASQISLAARHTAAKVLHKGEDAVSLTVEQDEAKWSWNDDDHRSTEYVRVGSAKIEA